MSESTKAILLRIPAKQVEKLEKLRKDRDLKNVQALLYRLIEKELEMNDN